MKHVDWVSKSLAILGTLLVAIPIAFMVMTGVASPFITGRGFMVDWLIPAELFPVVGVGSALLLAASLRSRVRRAWVLWGIGVMLVALVGGAVLAQVTGLASGEIEPAGWPWALVTGAIALYVATVVEMIVAGSLMLRDLFSYHGDEHAVPPAIPAA